MIRSHYKILKPLTFVEKLGLFTYMSGIVPTEIVISAIIDQI